MPWVRPARKINARPRPTTRHDATAIRDGLEAGALGCRLRGTATTLILKAGVFRRLCSWRGALCRGRCVTASGHRGDPVWWRADPEIDDRLVSRLSAAWDVGSCTTPSAECTSPRGWEPTWHWWRRPAKPGIGHAAVHTKPIKQRFTMHNCQVFRGMEHWHPILIGTDAEKMRSYSDPQVRQTLRADLDALGGTNPVFSKRWDLMYIEAPHLPRTRPCGVRRSPRLRPSRAKTARCLSGSGVDEQLETVFVLSEINVEPEAVAKPLTSPYTIVGLSDGGAHVQFDSGVGSAHACSATGCGSSRLCRWKRPFVRLPLCRRRPLVFTTGGLCARVWRLICRL